MSFDTAVLSPRRSLGRAYGRLRAAPLLAGPARDAASTLAIVLAGVAGVFLILFTTSRHGAAITTDSVTYIAAAQDLLEDGDLQNLRHAPTSGSDLVSWPPLYPAWIAVVSLGPGNAVDAARSVNALAFGAIVAAVGLWLRRLVASRWVLLGVVGTLSCAPFVSVAVYAWSEPTFALWLLLSSIASGRYLALGRNRDRRAAAIFAALAWLTRYIGVAVVFAGAVLVLGRRRDPFRTRLVRTAEFTAIATFPATLWMLRNRTVSGTWTGTRPYGHSPLSDQLRTTFDVLGSWFAPRWIPVDARGVAIGIATALIALTTTWLAFRRRSPGGRLARPETTALLVMTLTYLIYLVGTRTRVQVDPINTRYLSPVAIPLVLLIILAANFASRSLKSSGWGRWAKGAITLAVCAWLLVPAIDTKRLVVQARANGAGGYATDRWADSELLAYLRTGQPEGRLVSNHSAAVALYTDREVRSSPLAGNSSQLNSLATTARTTPVYLVWFNVRRGSRASLKDLQAMVTLVEVKKTSDGVLYRVMPRTGSP